jgi:hypothetical protein
MKSATPVKKEEYIDTTEPQSFKKRERTVN